MARRTLKQMTDAECIEAYRLNQRGEGCAMISGYGDVCSYQTANAMINRGERLLAPPKFDTYRVWISGQKERTLVTREFESAIAARLWIAARYDLKTYDAVAQRVEPVEDTVPSSRYIASPYSYDRD
jgi:hypothetical protein